VIGTVVAHDSVAVMQRADAYHERCRQRGQHGWAGTSTAKH
jgi:hypothetical protein